jgi:hypothetical protein
LEVPETYASSARASCFFTIPQTLSTVSFLAAQETANLKGAAGCRRRNASPFLAGANESEFVLGALTSLARETTDPAMEEAMGTDGRGGGGHPEKAARVEIKRTAAATGRIKRRWNMLRRYEYPVLHASTLKNYMKNFIKNLIKKYEWIFHVIIYNLVKLEMK